MTTRDKKQLSEQDQIYLELLLNEREKYESQMNFHNDEALHFSKSSASEISGLSNHIADCATDSFLHEIGLSMMTVEGDIIEQIDEAIERLETGEYGICHDCEHNINPERLKAIPHTKYCIECQSIREINDGKNIVQFDYDEEGHEIYKQEAS